MKTLPSKMGGGSGPFITNWNRMVDCLNGSIDSFGAMRAVPPPGNDGNIERYVKLHEPLHGNKKAEGHLVRYNPSTEIWETVDVNVKVHGTILFKGYAFVDDIILCNYETGGLYLAKGIGYTYLYGQTKQVMTNGSEVDYVPITKSSTIKVQSSYHTGTLPKDTYVGCFWDNLRFFWDAALQNCTN